MQHWWGIVGGVAVLPPQMPIRWDGYVGQIILGLSVKLFVSAPRYAIFCHVIGPVLLGALVDVQLERTGERIVELGVGDQTAWIIRLAVGGQA